MPMNVYRYDLLINNARVYDPVKGIDTVASIGIVYPNIAEVFNPADMAARQIRVCASKSLDAKNNYVSTGWIDYHSHVLPGIEFSVTPEDLYPMGVVATCDQGSATHYMISEFRKQYMDAKAKMVINATLQVSSTGWLQQDIFSVPVKELINVEKMIRMIGIHRDVVIGVKSEIQTDDADLVRHILKCQSQICRATNTHMVCHISGSPIPFDEYITYFEAGDVVCHAYNGIGKNLIIDDNKKVWDSAFEARKRGVLYDTARGHRHWNAAVARAAFEQGLYPDLVTADSTALGDKPLTCQLPTIMSEVMALGMSFDDVLTAVTYTAASKMKGVTVGIEQGNPANLTIFTVREEPIEFSDADGNKSMGDKLFVPLATIVNGEVLYNAL